MGSAIDWSKTADRQGCWPGLGLATGGGYYGIQATQGIPPALCRLWGLDVGAISILGDNFDYTIIGDSQ